MGVVRQRQTIRIFPDSHWHQQALQAREAKFYYTNHYSRLQIIGQPDAKQLSTGKTTPGILHCSCARAHT